jgi:hypothetical protein
MILMAQPQSNRQQFDLRARRFDLLFCALKVVERLENDKSTDQALAELIRAGRAYRRTVDVLKDQPDVFVVDSLSEAPPTR